MTDVTTPDETAEETTPAAPPAQETPKPAAEAKPDEKAAAPAEEKTAEKEGAPDLYELKAPDGQEFDDTVLTEFAKVAHKLDLPEASAQEILDKVGPVLQARALERHQALRAEWTESAKADKEFGGEKFKENLAIAKKALEKFGRPDFVKYLAESGLGDHPEMIRTFLKIGKAIREDIIVPGGGPVSAPKTPAEVLYGDK